MTRPGGIVKWQWQGYAGNHRSRANLLLHIIAVPAFIGAVLAAINLAMYRFWQGALFASGVAVLSFGLQAIGHRLETQAPVPFDGPGDFLARLFIEQFITFPRFVLSGGWLRGIATGTGQD